MELDRRRHPAFRQRFRGQEARLPRRARREWFHPFARPLSDGADARVGRPVMRGIPDVPNAAGELGKARKLAWASIVYICSTIVLLFMVMSGSQALKTEMSGELLSLIPPTLFLIGDKIGRREPNERYPFGYERAVSAVYVGAAVALFLVGAYLLIDGGMKLAMRE